MRTKRELYSDAMRTLSARRQSARAMAEDERRRTLAAVPGLAEAEEDFRRCGIRAALCGAQGKGRDEATGALNAARAKRDALLAESGRPTDWMEPKFRCRKCQDTGTVNGHTCECVRALMRKMRREEIERMSSLSVQSFDTLHIEYYPDAPGPVAGRTVRRYMAGVFSDLKAYAEDFDHDSMNLLLCGNAGLGKTHAALAVAGVVLDKGFDVIYISSPDFFGRVEDLRFGSDNAGEKAALLEAASEADLLILDDLGTELVTPYMLSVFYSLLNDRMTARHPTIFTTNITDTAVLEKRYTEKIASRLAFACEPFHFYGDDIRVLKAKEI